MCGLHPLPSLGPAGDSCELAKREASTNRQLPAMRLRHMDCGDAGTMQFQQSLPAGNGVLERKPALGLDPRWVPARTKKIRQHKNPTRGFDSIGIEKALGWSGGRRSVSDGDS